MELGTLLIKRENFNELDLPVFVWEVVEDTEKIFCIVNSEKGYTNVDVKQKFPERNLLLPNHSKFKFNTDQELNAGYALHLEDGYHIVSELILSAHQKWNGAPMFFVNAAYGFMQLVYNLKFSNSKYCKSAEDRIKNDPYSLIIKLTSIENESERQGQNLKNLKCLITLDFIPKRFIMLKVITVLKEIVKDNFPSDNEIFSNSLIEKLSLGMFLGYYKEHRDKIKSVTLNYSQNFPGDHKVFAQFTSMLHKFDEEILMYQDVEKAQIEMELQAVLNGVKLPDRKEGKGIIMKLLEFDLGFWQRIILLDINKDVPVAKPYKEGFSESYNYMLLLPFFQWLAPHRFPSFEDKSVNAETFNKLMVERMKSFVDGKIS